MERKNAKKILVISGSSSLPAEMEKWFLFWKSRGYTILNWPKPIAQKKFLKSWPAIHKKFYAALEKTDIHFVANENKNGQKGYIGNGVFAEISFSAGLNLVRKKKINIILIKKPDPINKFSRDLRLWHKMGWLSFMDSKINKPSGVAID